MKTPQQLLADWWAGQLDNQEFHSLMQISLSRQSLPVATSIVAEMKGNTKIGYGVLDPEGTLICVLPLTTPLPVDPSNGGEILTDERIIELAGEHGEFQPSVWDTGIPQFHTGQPGVINFARAIEADLRASLAAPAIPTDHDEAVTLLSAVFDAWENGDDCHEDGDPSGTYMGKCFQLDDDVFKRCCDLLNRLHPPRNVAPAIPTVDRNAVLEEARKACVSRTTKGFDAIDRSYNHAVRHCAEAVEYLKSAAPATAKPTET